MLGTAILPYFAPPDPDPTPAPSSAGPGARAHGQSQAGRTIEAGRRLDGGYSMGPRRPGREACCETAEGWRAGTRTRQGAHERARVADGVGGGPGRRSGRLLARHEEAAYARDPLAAPAGSRRDRCHRAHGRGDGRARRARHPPDTVVALLPEARIDEIRAHPALRLAKAGEIAADEAAGLSDAARAAVEMWNERLARPARPREPSTENLSWDAAGRLPPDPPAHLRAMLRRHEAERRDEDR